MKLITTTTILLTFTNMNVVMNKHREGDKEKCADGLFILTYLLEKVPAES